jgi:hypothetical protein
MRKTSKAYALLLTLIISMSCIALLAAKPASAQAVSTPSVPDFTAKFVNNSYTTQPTTTTTTDPYTGKQSTITTPSQYVKDEYIEVQITNQAFTPYTTNIQNVDTRVNLYFYVLSKGHFSTDWSVVDDSANVMENYSSQFTTIKLYTDKNIPSPAQIDFKAQATIGFLVNVYDDQVPVPASYKGPLYNVGINGTSSDWSPTQTLTIGASPNSPTPAATVPELSWLVIVPLLLSLFAVAVVVRHRKTANFKQ